MDTDDSAESGAGPLAQLATAVAFLGRLDARNLRMLPRALGILARPSLRDWVYNRVVATEEVPRALRNLVLSPADMNVFQRHCPVAGYVSTPEDGILAGFTHHGRMSTLLYPHTGFTQQLTYFERGGAHLNGARPREGGFFGVEVGGEHLWFWESRFDHEMSPGPDHGTLAIRYGGPDAPVEATEHVSVPPGSGAVVRDLTVRNTGDRPVERLVYYTQANANANQQYPPGVTSPNRAVARDGRVRWTDRTSEVSVRMRAGPDTAVTDAGVADAPLSDLFDAAGRTVSGRYLGGYLALDASIAPGESATVSVVVDGSDGRDSGADGHGTAPAVPRTPAQRRAASGHPWTDYLGDAPLDAVPDRFAAQYERSAAAVLKLFNPASGSLSAAPNVQPTYYPSWPRDGAFLAVALAEVGAAGPAKAYLRDFLPRVQEPDGGFEQCYTSDGARAGVIARENDQQCIYVHAVREVFEHTGDEAFLRDAWPAVEAALEYTIDAIADNDLLVATPDFAEMPADARQSLWTNAFAYRGLLDGAVLAKTAGADPAPYRRASRRVGDAVDRQFFDGREAFDTILTIRGAERDDNVAFAAAVHPTGWADAYGRTDAVLDACERMYAESTDDWLPREFIFAGALSAAGRTEAADAVLERLQDEHLPGGTLAEEVDPTGDHRFAALGWANAAFVHAVNVRAGVVPATRG